MAHVLTTVTADFHNAVRLLLELSLYSQFHLLVNRQTLGLIVLMSQFAVSLKELLSAAKLKRSAVR
jgi:hypothetical protein